MAGVESNDSNNLTQYSNIHKYDLNLGTTPQDTDDIRDLAIPPFHKGWRACRVIFNQYAGTVLGARIGMVVNDPHGYICHRSCCCPKIGSCGCK